MINLDEVLTFSEAAEKWGLADGKSIRKAVERNKFQAHEIKKSGNVWLTTYDAMYRVFGEPRENSTIFTFYDLFNFNHRSLPDALQEYVDRAQRCIERGEMVTIVETKEHPERILCILRTQEELEGWKRRLSYYFQTSSIPQSED